jgi:hypothetical protein
MMNETAEEKWRKLAVLPAGAGLERVLECIGNEKKHNGQPFPLETIIEAWADLAAPNECRVSLDLSSR